MSGDGNEEQGFLLRERLSPWLMIVSQVCVIVAFFAFDDPGTLGLVLVLVALAGIGVSVLDLVVGKSGIRVDRLGIHRQGIRKTGMVVRWDDVADVVIGTNRQGHSELQAVMTDGGSTDLGINRPAWRSRVIRYFRDLP